MFEIGVIGQFEAAHRLHGAFGPATNLHGHTYRLEVTLRAPELRLDGTLFDLARLRELVDAVSSSLHYQDLDAMPDLAGRNTTAETVADYCWERIAAGLTAPPSATLGVRVYESPQAWAAREDALPSSS
ncbi:MAG: 6-pyruvoyl trahydropterin synthase family protein [Solirubrobacteraceae bacterium]